MQGIISRKLAILMGLLESGRMLTGVVHAFFLINRGVTLKQLALLQMASSATILLFAIPIGLFADMVSRKLTTLIALVFIATFYYLCLWAPSLMPLLIGKVLYAAGLSAIAYATEAWALDTIFTEYPDARHMANYFGYLKKEVAGFGNMLTGIIGSVIAYTLGYEALYFISVGLMFLLVIAFAWIPTTQKLYTKNHTSIVLTTKTAVGALLTTRSGVIYILAALLIIAVYQPVYHFWQPLFVNFFKNSPLLPPYLREPIPILGLTFVWVNAFILLINYLFRKRMFQQWNYFKIGVVVAIVVGLCFVVLGMNRSNNPWPSLLAFGLIHGFLTILNNIAINQYTIQAPSKQLSAILSFAYLGQCIMAIGVLAIIKQVINEHNLGIIFASCVIPMLLLSLVFVVGGVVKKTS